MFSDWLVRHFYVSFLKHELINTCIPMQRSSLYEFSVIGEFVDHTRIGLWPSYNCLYCSKCLAISRWIFEILYLCLWLYWSIQWLTVTSKSNNRWRMRALFSAKSWPIVCWNIFTMTESSYQSFFRHREIIGTSFNLISSKTYSMNRL